MGTGGGAESTSEKIQRKKDSSALQDMAKTITGPLKTAALGTIKSLVAAGVLVGAVAAGTAGGTAIKNELGIGTTPAEAFTQLNRTGISGMTGEESLENMIQMLDEKATQLEEAGDWEGAREVRDQLARTRDVLQNLRDKAKDWDGSLEEAVAEVNRANKNQEVITNFFGNLKEMYKDVVDLVGGGEDSTVDSSKKINAFSKQWAENVEQNVLLTDEINGYYRDIRSLAREQARNLRNSPVRLSGSGFGTGVDFAEERGLQPGDFTGKETLLLNLGKNDVDLSGANTEG
jgi:hypothetical protein